MRAYQRLLPELDRRDASLVAVSPMLPDGSLSVAETNALAFAVLSDVGNRVARTYGLVYRLDDRLRELYAGPFGIDLPAHNGDGSWELAVPGTFVIGRGGTIGLAHADADYTRRLEPAAILAALDAGEAAGGHEAGPRPAPAS